MILVSWLSHSTTHHHDGRGTLPQDDAPLFLQLCLLLSIVPTLHCALLMLTAQDTRKTIPS